MLRSRVFLLIVLIALAILAMSVRTISGQRSQPLRLFTTQQIPQCYEPCA